MEELERKKSRKREEIWKGGREDTKTGNRRTNVLGSMDNKEERQRRKSGTHSMGDGGRFIEEGEGGL